ncbi:MAG: leucine-rich repeat protein [Corallococcus sp.]|nr:leucine-rich repeat protein [Corallococcus sp.]
MKSQAKQYVRRFFTVFLVVVMATSFIVGATLSSEVYADGFSGGKISATDITGIANSLVDEYALKEDIYDSARNDDELYWVIVRFKNNAVLDTALTKDPKNIYNYIDSPSAVSEADSLIAQQNNFITKYQSVIKDTSYRYTTLFNGIAMQVRYGDIKRLKSDSSVENVIICERYYAPLAVTQNEVNVYETGIYDSGDLEYDGSGTVVAVLDTGLDYTHSVFANQPYGTLALNKDKVNSLLSGFTATQMSAANNVELTADDLYVSDKVPFAYDYADSDSDVYPINNHGTHVAGIIAGKDDVITGIATNAQLAIMKVFSNYEEYASSEGILAALNDCVVLGVDAINMSLGSSCGFARETDNDAVNDIYDKIQQTGICLITAASNDYNSAMQSTYGDTNLTSNPDSGTVGSPSSYSASMSVASISGVKTKYLIVNGEAEVYFTESSHGGSERNDFAKEMLNGRKSAEFEYVVVPGLGTPSNYTGIDVTGKIAVIKRGNTSFEDKITLAQSNGAIGVIIYNNISGTISMSVGKATIPSCSISMDLGKYFESHTSGIIRMDETYLAGPFMSDFSSWGPLPNLEFKPDITAHGGDIYSAVRDGYDHYSGTSMASPNMAGATILVRQYVKERFPEMSANEVTQLTYQLIMSSATIAYNEEGNPYSPRKQGAGLADIGKSVNTGAYIYVEGLNKPKLSLGDDPQKTGEYEMTFKVKNISSQALSYKINPIVMTESLSSDNKTVAQKAYMLNDSGIAVYVSGSGVTLGEGNSLSVAGYRTAEVTVKITLTDAAKAYLDKTFANGMYVEGFIELQSQNADNINLNIPYMAFYGDWAVAPMLDVTAYEVGEQQEDSSILEEDKLQPDVYATLPMAGFRYKVSATEYEESYYGMGQFGYKYPDGVTEPAITEEKASLTANMDGSYSLKVVAAGLLRNAKAVRMKVVNSVTGELIWEGEDYDVRKSYYSGGRRPGVVEVEFKVNDYNLPGNTKYTFSMECDLDWTKNEGNLNNTFSFDFYIDNEAPVLIEDKSEVRVETVGGKKRYYLDLYVYDNHYLQGYAMGTFSYLNEDGSFEDQQSFFRYVMPYTNGRRNAENRITYEITDYWSQITANDGNVYLQVIDYAKNISILHLTLPSSKAENIAFKSTKRNVNIRVNGAEDLKEFLDMTPTNLWVKDLKWSIDDESVALIKDGVVLGVGVGETLLRVSNADGSKEATLPVIVRAATNDKIDVTRIELNKNYSAIERGEEFTLTASITPHDLFADNALFADAADKFADDTVTWSTSGGVIKFVIENAQGEEELVDRVVDAREVTVRSLKSGSATINVTVPGSARVSSSCSVYVKSEFEVEGSYLRSYTGRGDENGVVVIPDDLNITYIYPQAIFNNDYIKKIIIPEGVEEIMEAGIYGCDNLEEVILPSTCKKLDKWALAWNPNLVNVDMGGVDTIDDMAFIMNEKLASIDLSKVSFIGPRAFAYCSALKSVDLSFCKSIDSMAFLYCSALESISTSETTPIGDYAFYACDALVSLELNSSQIGSFAFAFCNGLQSVTFNNAIDTIGQGAFYSCKALEEVNYHSTVRVIGNFAFTNCAFDTVYIPAGVESIGLLAYSFDDTYASMYGGTSKVVISADAKLTSIDSGIFYLCRNFSAIEVEEGNAYLASSNGILYDKAYKTLLLCPYGYSDRALTLPSTVTKIGNGAFYGNSAVRSLTASNVETIGYRAFMGTNITTLSLGNNVKYIDDYAFYSAKSLAAFPSCFDNVEYIGERAFQSSGLTGTVVLPESVKSIDQYCFADTGITGIVLNDALTEIPNLAFTQCESLKTVTIGNNVKKIGEFAFAYCSALETITIPDSVEEIDYGAFGYCTSLKSITLSDNMTEIADYMFTNCTSLKEITLPDKITKIGEGAFAVISEDNSTFDNGALTSINLDNVVEIGAAAFIKSPLKEINAPKLKTLGSRGFAYVQATTVSMPVIETVGTYAFFSATALTSIDVSSAKYIGDRAFSGCTALQTLDLSSAEEIGAFAMYHATKLSEVKLDSVKIIGQAAFAETAIEKLSLPASLTELKIQALYMASKLSEVEISQDNSVYFTDETGVVYQRLPNGFYTLVYYPAALTETEYTLLAATVRIEGTAFSDNKTLTKVVLPERLQTIGAKAFYGCAGLETIEINSAAAPTLESMFSNDLGIDDHTYDNLLAGKEVKIIYPSNGSGYDGYVWQQQYAENLLGEGVVVRTQTTIDMSDTLSAIETDALTLDDIKQIVMLRRIYSSLDDTQRGFLTAVIGTLGAAETKLSALVTELIAALPEEITLNDRAAVTRARAIYNSLNSEMRGKVGNLSVLSDAEARLEQLSAETPADEPAKGLTTGAIIGISVSAGVVVLAAAAVAVIFAMKRKKAVSVNAEQKSSVADVSNGETSSTGDNQSKEANNE